MKRFFLGFILSLVVLGVSFLFADIPAIANIDKKVEKEKLEKKINELKTKEKVEINKLTKTQKNLERTEKSIESYQSQLSKSRINMSNLQSKLNYLDKEHEKLAVLTRQRIRNIYKGERIGLLYAIFASKDLSSFFDMLYYQKSIIKKDKELMDQLQSKTEDLMRSKNAIEYEKRNISYTLKSMNKKKRSLNYSIQTSEYLINKLRTDMRAYEQAQTELESLSRTIEKNLAKSSSKDITDSAFIRPIVGTITSPFGWRRHPIFNSTRFHSGVDIAGPNRTPIKASNAGKVIHSGWYGGYGKVVIVNHGELKTGAYAGKKVSTLYAHMSSTAVNVGTYVKKGDVVGYEGTTGYSTGPHLHFEVRIDGKPINPLDFVGN